jgi:hypothetical protein
VIEILLSSRHPPGGGKASGGDPVFSMGPLFKNDSRTDFLLNYYGKDFVSLSTIAFPYNKRKE